MIKWAIVAAATFVCGGLVIALVGLAALTPLLAAGKGKLSTSVSSVACGGVTVGGGQDLELSKKQHQVARKIIVAGKKAKIPAKGQEIALMTAMQETRMGAAKGINKPNADGDAGVFQQRTKPGWYGTLEQILDVSYAAKAFYKGVTVKKQAAGAAGPPGYHIPGLVDLDSWKHMALTEAAQAVQRSAFPDAYARWESLAEKLVASTSGSCDEVGDVPVGASKKFKKIFAKMKAELGVDYVYGGGSKTGPTGGGFDCSSYVMYGYYQGAHINLPRTSAAQYQASKDHVVARRSAGLDGVLKKLKPGDLLFWGSSAGGIHHVAVYIGHGKQIAAPHTGTVTKIQPVYFGDFFAATRILGTK